MIETPIQKNFQQLPKSFRYDFQTARISNEVFTKYIQIELQSLHFHCSNSSKHEFCNVRVVTVLILGTHQTRNVHLKKPILLGQTAAVRQRKVKFMRDGPSLIRKVVMMFTTSDTLAKAWKVFSLSRTMFHFNRQWVKGNIS